ncbi:MAG: tripartite tricarboxylate transporter substrate binding protein [Rhizobiales bacterium]|nr:tripartite tricarboxylate transporter substrate binding protein [Hyphomicrobiales bacterium]
MGRAFTLAWLNNKATREDTVTTALGRIAGVALALFAFTPSAAAQTYPTRTITLIVPFAPGGPADVLGRVIGQKLSDAFGQQVIVDNRSGANTIVGAQAAARAKPDGYTLLLAIDGTLVMNPYLYTKLPYDPFKDFEPVTLVAAVPSGITANIKTPVTTLQDIIDIEKAKPGTLQIGVSTPTTQVAIGLLNMRAGINLTMVPYRGGTTQITSLLAGDIPIGHESVNVALPLYRAKKIKIIALTSPKRIGLAPEIPTVAETFPDFDLGIWQSVVAPAGTPKDIVSRLHAAINKILAMPDVRDRLTKIGIQPSGSQSPEEFAAFVRSQAETRSKVIKAVGIKIE